jgi:hypothetical protein
MSCAVRNKLAYEAVTKRDHIFLYQPFHLEGQPGHRKK